MPLGNAHYPNPNPDWALEGSPTAFKRANMDRLRVTSDFAILTTQVMLNVAVVLQAGETVTNITFKSGTTAAGTPTNYWFALYDDSATPALLAQTADQLTAAWAANTAKTLALSAPQTVPRSGVYRAAIMVKATTPPSLLGVATLDVATGGFVSGDKPLAQLSGSSLTTTAPATVASPTAISFVPRVVLT